MIPNSKYEDKAFMISELCEMFKADELPQLTASFCPPHMSPEEFDYKYTKHLKRSYLEHLLSIQNGTYKKIPFQKLNQQILEAVNSNTQNKEHSQNKAEIQSMIHRLRNRQK